MRIEFQKEDNVSTILDIIFWKTAPGKRRIINGKELIDITCQVSRVMYADKPMTLITKTKARQNPIDDYNKITGKKVALAKAIANIAFLKYIRELGKESSMNLKRRSMRQHIWNVFHQTFGRWN